MAKNAVTVYVTAFFLTRHKGDIMIKLKKFVAILVGLLMTLQICCLNSLSAFADGEAGKLQVSVRMDTAELHVGDVVEARVSLDFGNNELPHGGIYVFVADLKYDAKILEPVNQGNNNSPSYAVKGDIMGNDKLTSSVPAPGTLRLFYGDNTSKNITQSGLFASISFQVLDTAKAGPTKIFFDDSLKAYSQEQNPGETKKITFATTYLDWNLKVAAPFSFEAPFIVTKGDNIKVSGTTEVTPLYLTLTSPSGGEIFRQELLSDANGNFQQEIPTKESFDSGNYVLKLTYNQMVLDRTIALKNDGDTVVDPEETARPDETDPPAPTSSPVPTSTKKPEQSGSVSNGSGTSTLPPNGSTTPTAAPQQSQEPSSSGYPNDIDGHWAKENIEYIYDNALMNGYDDGSFRPDSSITRGEFCTVMYRYLGLKPEAGKVFEDTAGHWAETYISALAARGIVGGVSDTLFEPEEEITREQIAAILDRAFQLGGKTAESKFADEAEISDWAYESVYDVLAAGYMQGDENNNFAPQAQATRAEVATIIYRLHTGNH